jgi:SAM-dependent methyltransferase
MRESEAPVPPEWIAARAGPLEQGDPFGSYIRAGRDVREGIDALLGPEWLWEGKRVLDFGCGSGRVLRHFLGEASTVAEFHGSDIDGPAVEWVREHLCPPLYVVRNETDPPLPYDSQSFDLIYATSVFTHLFRNWSTWLLELHRLLVHGGTLIATTLGPVISQEVAGERWEEARIGMNVLGLETDEWGMTYILHSEWWLRAHWGRAFEIDAVHPVGFGPQGVVVMRRRDVALTPEDLEALEPDEPREVIALQHNVRQLFRGSPKVRERVDHYKRLYEGIAESRSWRMTKPLRDLADRARKPRAK